jgi:SNF2 family DNA or RNA helicase
VENDDDSDVKEDDDAMTHMGDGYYLFSELYNQLYSHQREGVLWMWSLFKKKKGGILGDDMGLGKTIQVIAYLSGMFDAENIKTVLIILPVAVITNWDNEFEKWYEINQYLTFAFLLSLPRAPGISVQHFHSNSKRDRDRALMKVQKRGGVCLTSYGMLVNNSDQLRDLEGREFVWDYVILDEGHKIKNPANKCSKGIHSIPARHRLILTGTPVQNNLKEMWALFDWTHQGKIWFAFFLAFLFFVLCCAGSLLGTRKTFNMEYENPIVRAREKDATAGQQKLGQHIAQSLQKIIAPYFLRRTKADVKKNEAVKKEEKMKSDKILEPKSSSSSAEAPL